MSVLILSSLLLISIAGLASLIVYKVSHVGSGNYDLTEDDTKIEVLPANINKKLAYALEHTCRKYTNFVFSSTKNLYKNIEKSILDKRGAFSDAVNGKNIINKRGAASLFLKNISRHKEEFSRKEK